MQQSNLPKLLYIGDVSISNTVAGEVLLYRLLQTYYANRLQILEGNTVSVVSTAANRLQNVTYFSFSVGNRRLLHSRLVGPYSVWLHMTARFRWQKLKPLIDSFKPDTILTVLHGFSWLTAAAVAEKYDLPLQVIVHDDWPRSNLMPDWFQKVIDRDFGKVYAQGVARYCVSPYMEEMYRQLYGVAGTVLYPYRASEACEFDAPPPKVRENKGGITMAYAGSLHIPGYIASLIKLAEFLEPYNGHLNIYSILDDQAALKVGLARQNVSIKPLIPSPVLVERLRDEADALYVPMTFEKQLHIHMQTSFPSKLTEYTATGLPILIWGPPYCSAVRWARENEGVAEVVDDPNPEALKPVVQRLATQPSYRYQLGAKALKIGKQYFSHATAKQKFFQNLQLSEGSASAINGRR